MKAILASLHSIKQKPLSVFTKEVFIQWFRRDSYLPGAALDIIEFQVILIFWGNNGRTLSPDGKYTKSSEIPINRKYQPLADFFKRYMWFVRYNVKKCLPIMFTQPPVWLYADELKNRYSNFCQYNGINERRIVKLFDSFLLCGINDRNAKKVKILQESFDDLIKLVSFNSLLRSGEDPKGKLPDYLRHKFPIQYEGSRAWYTCKELLKMYSVNIIQVSKMNCIFIGELIRMGLLIGQYNRAERCYLINARSWLWLMKFHEHILKLYGMLP